MSDIELIEAPESTEGSEGLLAIIVRTEFSPRQHGTHFFTHQGSPLQLGSICRPAGWIVPAHTHVGVHPQCRGTQEVFIVKEGRIRLHVYTSESKLVKTVEVGEGDIVMLVSGGHGLEFLEESHIVEVKRGPYAGPQEKVLLGTVPPIGS